MMLLSEKIAAKPSVKIMQERYEYWENVPKRGLLIGGKPAITQIDPEKIGEYMIVTVRDPLAIYDKDPAELIADRLENVELAGKSGLFTTYTGWYKGAKISVCSGGSGCPEAELALNDFMEYTNCSAFLRVGTSGGIAEKIKIGDCVITSGVFREDGTSRAYVPDGFPAACHYELVAALVEAAESAAIPYHVGVTACMDSDFVGNGRPSVGGYFQPRNIEQLGLYNRAGVLNTDRESSILVTMCNLFERRGGAVFCVTDNILSGEKFQAGKGNNESITLALEGLAVLKQMDNRKLAAQKNGWYPSLGI